MLIVFFFFSWLACLRDVFSSSFYPFYSNELLMKVTFMVLLLICTQSPAKITALSRDNPQILVSSLP